MWRQSVACPDRFGDKTCAFLDEFSNAGKLSRSGTFKLKDNVNQLVPYELLPIRIKRLVNMLPLDRKKFTSGQAYKSAITKLYVYGYLPDLDKAIAVRTQHWKEFRRKWSIDEATENGPHPIGNDAWFKSIEDVAIFKDGESPPVVDGSIESKEHSAITTEAPSVDGSMELKEQSTITAETPSVDGSIKLKEQSTITAEAPSVDGSIELKEQSAITAEAPSVDGREFSNSLDVQIK